MRLTFYSPHSMHYPPTCSTKCHAQLFTVAKFHILSSNSSADSLLHFALLRLASYPPRGRKEMYPAWVRGYIPPSLPSLSKCVYATVKITTCTRQPPSRTLPPSPHVHASLLPRPSHHPVLYCKQSRAGRWEGPGARMHNVTTV